MTHRPQWSYWYLAMGFFAFLILLAINLASWRLGVIALVGVVMATPAFPLKKGMRSLLLVLTLFAYYSSLPVVN